MINRGAIVLVVSVAIAVVGFAIGNWELYTPDGVYCGRAFARDEYGVAEFMDRLHGDRVATTQCHAIARWKAYLAGVLMVVGISGMLWSAYNRFVRKPVAP